MNEQRINLHGAIDLAALAATRKVQEQRASQTQTSPSQTSSDVADSDMMFDVTVEAFESAVLQQSMNLPVVLVFWTPRSETSLQLSQTLEKLAREDHGAWLLGKINVDDAPQLVTAFQIQTVPVTFAVIGGQPVPLFQGVAPEHKMREVIDAVLAQAVQMGLPGTKQSETNTAEEVPLDPQLEAAQDALNDGNWAAAKQAYQELLTQNPSDQIARIGLLNVELFERIDGVDFDSAIACATESLDSQLLAADCEFIMNEWGKAFTRLIECVRNSTGSQRDQARERLLQLFDVAGPNDATVIQARTELANALF